MLPDSPTVLVSFNQFIDRLPLKQVEHHRPELRGLRCASIRHLRICRCGTRIGPVTDSSHRVENGVLEQRHPELVCEDIQSDKPIIGRMRAVEVLMIQGVGVKPLNEIFKVVHTCFRQGARRRSGFFEAIRRIQCRGKKGRYSGEEFLVSEELMPFGADGDSHNGLKEFSKASNDKLP